MFVPRRVCVCVKAPHSPLFLCGERRKQVFGWGLCYRGGTGGGGGNARASAAGLFVLWCPWGTPRLLPLLGGGGLETLSLAHSLAHSLTRGGGEGVGGGGADERRKIGNTHSGEEKRIGGGKGAAWRWFWFLSSPTNWSGEACLFVRPRMEGVRGAGWGQNGAGVGGAERNRGGGAGSTTQPEDNRLPRLPRSLISLSLTQTGRCAP